MVIDIPGLIPGFWILPAGFDRFFIFLQDIFIQALFFKYISQLIGCDGVIKASELMIYISQAIPTYRILGIMFNSFPESCQGIVIPIEHAI